MSAPFREFALWALLLGGCWELAIGAETPPLEYESATAALKVESIARAVLHDPKRSKELQIRIHYPTGQGPFPLIVWSHGAGGSKDNYLTLMEHWASRGYVTIQPTHSDSRSLAAKASDPVSFRDWQGRPADISFILDSLAELAQKEPVLAG